MSERSLNGLSRSIQRLRTIVEEEAPPCLAISELDLMETWLSNLRKSEKATASELLDALLDRINFDGMDPNTFTIAELRRAI